MSTWNIYVENSSGTWDADGTVPRPNDDLETTLSSTITKSKLASGTNGFVTPETKSVKEPITIYWANANSALRTKIETYINNGDRVKILAHTGETFIGYPLSMKRVWLCGVESGDPDEYEIQVIMELTE